MTSLNPSSLFGASSQPLQATFLAEQIHTPAPAAYISQPAKRLYWTMQGPLTSSIFIMPEDCNPDAPHVAYFQQTLTGTTWHPISQEAMTEQPVASITVEEEHLSDWQDTWWMLNQEGFDEDVQPAPDDEPPTFEPLVVTASGDFVTVHDFVTAVHPWLMMRRELILRARNADDDSYTPGPDEKLLVSADRPELVIAEDQQEWHAALMWVFEERLRRQQASTD